MGIQKLIAIFCFIAAEIAFSAKPDHLLLEKLEIRGTNRIRVERIRNELNLIPSTRLDDQKVLAIRKNLIGLGLFKSVILYMRKGSQPGYARLIIEVEDDETVLGSWAIGSEVAVTSGTLQSSIINPNSRTYGYKANIVSRNIFEQGHRASLGIDIDDNSVLRQAHMAYGLPRFSQESVQFDAKIQIVDARHRYLDTLGFGQKGEARWTADREYGSIEYGVAMYINQKQRYLLPGFPKYLVGPKVSFGRETRLLGFTPKPGYGYKLSLMIPPAAKKDYVFEMGAGATYEVFGNLWGTLEARALTIGTKGLSTRLKASLILPVNLADDKTSLAKFFFRLRLGSDRLEKTRLNGSSATLGIRYYSQGLIAEIGFKVTKVPEQIEPLLTPRVTGVY